MSQTKTNDLLTNLDEKFLALYGTESDGGKELYHFHAPGRVNLIGEHTDYNGGFVFPCALDFGTYATVRRRSDQNINFASLNLDQRALVSLDTFRYDKSLDWINYPLGVVQEFKSLGHTLGGLDILIYGNIPNGAGLSSSASVELLTSVILNELFNCGLQQMELVKLSQHAENHFIGVNCGIMDQFAVGMGRVDHAMFLDCETLAYEHVPLKLDGYKLVIGNTNKIRGLADSKYNERRSECEQAFDLLKPAMEAEGYAPSCLGKIKPLEFEKFKAVIQDKIVLNRAAHVIYEDFRVYTAISKLKSGDLKAFGALMNESHDSLRDLYEVTGIELDSMVSEARKIEGVLGSRMTGAGFGGCTVSIVAESAVPTFIQTIGENYKAKTGLTPEFYVANSGNGAGWLN